MKLIGTVLAGALEQLAKDVRRETGRADAARSPSCGNGKEAGTEAPASTDREETSAPGSVTRNDLRLVIGGRCRPAHPKASAMPPLGAGRHLLLI